MTLTHKQRLLIALKRSQAYRLPITTHQLMQYFLDKYLSGAMSQAFFERFDLDAITWVVYHKPNEPLGDYKDSLQGETGFLEARRVWSDRRQTFS